MIRLSRIYTRTGDTGTTSLGDGSRVHKNASRLEAIGAVDEANSAIGIIRLYTAEQDDDMLARIQNDLFDVGADLCMPSQAEKKRPSLRITHTHILRLETEIDKMNEELKPLESFILPGGSPGSAFSHQARVIVRRCERVLVSMSKEEWVNSELLIYINRLSDHLFVLARHLNAQVGGDVLWEPGKYSE